MTATRLPWSVVKVNFVPTPGSAFLSAPGAMLSFQANRGGKRRRPIRFDSFMRMTPSVAVART